MVFESTLMFISSTNSRVWSTKSATTSSPMDNPWRRNIRRMQTLQSTRSLVTAALVLGAAPGAAGSDYPDGCSWTKFRLPESPPEDGTTHNGVSLQDVCFGGETIHPHHVFVIGDWGGVNSDNGVHPADRRTAAFGPAARAFVSGIDDSAQTRVAEQMKLRAASGRSPDYVLNVGDNFYWAGIKGHCGEGPGKVTDVNLGQWNAVFENMYTGPELNDAPWLSVLGNHDYGGFSFLSGWDRQIGHSWQSPSGRWMMPGQYWKVKVWYPGFSIDYFFVDTNVFDAGEPGANEDHNICAWPHNAAADLLPHSCGLQGPESIWDCPRWFGMLWDNQMDWLEMHLEASTASWQIVVTHFPPVWGHEDWAPLCARWGIDLLVTGHIHSQYVQGSKDLGNPVRPTVVVVSGGGGGITSEGVPSIDGNDDSYGFYDLTLEKDRILIEGISHSGKLRSTTEVLPRPKNPQKYRYREPHLGFRGFVARARAIDPTSILPCPRSPCPEEWAQGNPGVGGYFCPSKSDPLQGACQREARSDCPGQCYIGDPMIKSLAQLPQAKEPTRTLLKGCSTTESRRCIKEWGQDGEDSGYFCRSSGTCRPGTRGPIAFNICQDQCFVDSPRKDWEMQEEESERERIEARKKLESIYKEKALSV